MSKRRLKKPIAYTLIAIEILLLAFFSMLDDFGDQAIPFILALLAIFVINFVILEKYYMR